MSSKRSRLPKVIVVACVITYAVAVLSVGAYRAREDQSSTSDFDDFWKTGRHFLQTGELVEDYGVHNYLPFFVLFAAPFSILPIKVASVAFNAVALGGFALTVRIVDRWLRDDAGAGSPEATAAPPGGNPQPGPKIDLIGTVVMVLPYVTGCLVMGQMALYTLTMLVLCWNGLEKRRQASAGLWLALAISTKVYPIVVVGFFLLRGKWQVLAATLGGLVVMNVVLPGLVFGASDAWRLHRDFWQRSVSGQSSFHLAVVDSNKMSYTNQSSALVARRYTRPTDSGVDRPDGRPRFINLVNWDAAPVGIAGLRLARVQWLLAAAYAAITAATAWVCRPRARVLTMPRMRHEYAAFVLLGLLLSPIVWSFYYGLCYLPLALLNRRAVDQWRAGRRLTGSTLTAAAWWLAVPALASPLMRMGGYHLLATLALLVTMLVLASRQGPDIAAQANP